MSSVQTRQVGNLPGDLSSFIGRRRELGEVKRLLGESRLVTLTGPGGTGKTRLALRVGAELRRAFADGVWLVDLTQLRESGVLTENAQDPDVLAFLVTATLGLRDSGGGSPLGTLVEQLADRRLLLILDNCEHLIPASAILADALLRGCPRLRIVATSREPLTIAGETLFPVPPLPAPDPGRRPTLAELGRCDAVALFLARAQAIDPDFALTGDNQVAVAELCHRLDGLPLAIELAAARVRVLAPAQILDRLTDRFAMLSRGSRAAPGRQQTLRACVDWSFDLCAKPERVLWARLSVFAGGFELDAVEGICADEHLPEADVLDLMAGLVDKSILIRDELRDGHGGAASYRILETIRAYGQDRLREAGEDAALRRRHRDWHQQLVTRARAEWVSDRQGYWLARLARDHPNLRAAVEYSLAEPGEAEAALRIGTTLPLFYWAARGLFGELRRWLDRALAQATVPTVGRARGLLVNSHLAIFQGDPAAGMPLLDEGEGLASRLDAPAALAYAAFIRGVCALYAGDMPLAFQTLESARTSLSMAPEPDEELHLHVLNMLGPAAAEVGDHERAKAYVQEMLAIVEPGGGGLYRSIALWMSGLVAWLRGDLGEAVAQELGSLRIKRSWASDDPYGVAMCLEVLAWVTADQQRHERAATLLGAADTLLADAGAPITSSLHLVGHHEACERQARDALGDPAFAAAFHHGQVLAYEAVLAYALDEPRQPAPAPNGDKASPLTRRERQVADLLALGLSNKDIAAKFVISQRTAETHVEHILTKLGFTSRTQVARWIAQQHSDTSDARN